MFCYQLRICQITVTIIQVSLIGFSWVIEELFEILCCPHSCCSRAQMWTSRLVQCLDPLGLMGRQECCHMSHVNRFEVTLRCV